jgi:two-component system response regulator RpfG
MSSAVTLSPHGFDGEPFATPSSRVLVVDDQTTSRMILARIIHSIDASIDVHSVANPLEAIEWARLNAPDLVLTDYKMTEIDGIETTRRLRRLPGCEDVPIVMVTIIEDSKVCHAAFDAGVTDFLVKPYDQYECRARCRNLLSLRRQQLLLRNRTKLLESEIAAAVRELAYRERETIMLAANLSEYRAHQDGFRLVRISRYARIIAEGLELPPELVERIEVASTLHDVGKIGVADEILLAPGPLTARQEQAFREHAEIGYTLLGQSSSKFLKMGAEICLHHHERYDGSGYPKGLKGRDIPLSARILAVAEAFDLLTSTSGGDYARAAAAAIADIVSRKGIDFDPVCVEALACQLGRARDVIADFSDPD